MKARSKFFGALLLLAIPLLMFPLSPMAVPAWAEDGHSSGLVVTPTSLAFSYQQGGTLPASQKLSVTNTRSTSFTVTKSSATWLAVSATSGTTPASITVSVRPGTLPAGTYNASLTFASRYSSVTVPVTLRISSSSATARLIVSPSSLAFGYQQGGTAPA